MLPIRGPMSMRFGKGCEISVMSREKTLRSNTAVPKESSTAFQAS